jgi:hypothetical protein
MEIPFGCISIYLIIQKEEKEELAMPKAAE